MVASTDMNHINKLLDGVNDLDHNLDLKNLHITFEVGLLAILHQSSMFLGLPFVQEFYWNHLQWLSLAMAK